MRAMTVGLLALAVAAPAFGQGTAQGPRLPTVATLPAAPADPVKRAPVDGVLVLYGNEQCPTDSNGNEIVVCTRRSAREQFRVPKELRDFKVTPQNESWAKRAPEAANAGAATGIGSCTAVGPGGSTGCWNQQMGLGRQQAQEKKKDDAAVP